MIAFAGKVDAYRKEIEQACRNSFSNDVRTLLASIAEEKFDDLDFHPCKGRLEEVHLSCIWIDDEAQDEWSVFDKKRYSLLDALENASAVLRAHGGFTAPAIPASCDLQKFKDFVADADGEGMQGLVSDEVISEFGELCKRMRHALRTSATASFSETLVGDPTIVQSLRLLLGQADENIFDGMLMLGSKVAKCAAASEETAATLDASAKLAQEIINSTVNTWLIEVVAGEGVQVIDVGSESDGEGRADLRTSLLLPFLGRVVHHVAMQQQRLVSIKAMKAPNQVFNKLSLLAKKWKAPDGEFKTLVQDLKSNVAAAQVPPEMAGKINAIEAATIAGFNTAAWKIAKAEICKASRTLHSCYSAAQQKLDIEAMLQNDAPDYTAILERLQEQVCTSFRGGMAHVREGSPGASRNCRVVRGTCAGARAAAAASVSRRVLGKHRVLRRQGVRHTVIL